MNAPSHPLQGSSPADIEQYLAQALCELTGHFAEVALLSTACSQSAPDYAGEATVQIRVRFHHLPEPEGEEPEAL